MLNTGAYTYSMASNYNRVARPAVVLVSEGRVGLLARRETPEDLPRLDVMPQWLEPERRRLRRRASWSAGATLAWFWSAGARAGALSLSAA